MPVGGVSETTVAGDFEVEVLLNEDRTLSLKFFNRENSIQNFGEQIGYTQGVGLSYNIEFDNLRELFEELFKNKNKTKQTRKYKKKPIQGFLIISISNKLAHQNLLIINFLALKSNSY